MIRPPAHADPLLRLLGYAQLLASSHPGQAAETLKALRTAEASQEGAAVTIFGREDMWVLVGIKRFYVPIDDQPGCALPGLVVELGNLATKRSLALPTLITPRVAGAVQAAITKTMTQPPDGLRLDLVDIDAESPMMQFFNL